MPRPSYLKLEKVHTPLQKQSICACHSNSMLKKSWGQPKDYIDYGESRLLKKLDYVICEWFPLSLILSKRHFIKMTVKFAIFELGAPNFA